MLTDRKSEKFVSRRCAPITDKGLQPLVPPSGKPVSEQRNFRLVPTLCVGMHTG
jgi:hypothetical protein